MDKEICFLINNNPLFLDKVLVSFNDIPIFFVCCDSSNNYYIVLCTDVEDLEYIIIESSLHSLYQMLSKKVEMRRPFTKASHFWSVKAGDSMESDEMQHIEGKQMDQNNLPYPNAFYEARTKEDIAYVKQIEAACLEKDRFSVIESKIDINEALSTPIAFSLDFAKEFEPYFEWGSVQISPFERKTTVFNASNARNTSLAYKENTTWNERISTGMNKNAKTPTEADCLAA